MQRTHRPYKVTKISSSMVFFNEEEILNRVAIDRVTSVQPSPKDAKQVGNKDIGPLVELTPTPDYATNDAKPDEKDRKTRSTW